VFTDPLSVTYDGSSLSLPRTAMGKSHSRYTTADRQYEVFISHGEPAKDGLVRVSIQLTRRLPDPTPGNVFDDYRDIRNIFGFSYGYDAQTRAESSVDIPKLRTALDSFVTSTLQGRLIAGER
jgi:hypothetical protein